MIQTQEIVEQVILQEVLEKAEGALVLENIGKRISFDVIKQMPNLNKKVSGLKKDIRITKILNEVRDEEKKEY